MTTGSDMLNSNDSTMATGSDMLNSNDSTTADGLICRAVTVMRAAYTGGVLTDQDAAAFFPSLFYLLDCPCADDEPDA